MNAIASPELTSSTLRELDAYLHATQNRLSPSEIANLAVREWLAKTENRPAREASSSARGFQWKCLFLPESTDVRMDFRGDTFHARVVGDALIFQGRRVSPRQMTLAVAGEGRNAWRELRLRFPGNPAWKSAWAWRRELQKDMQGAPTSPMDAMAAAAASMSATLKAALLLVEHVKERALPPPERRIDKHRRAEDLMIDACKFD